MRCKGLPPLPRWHENHALGVDLACSSPLVTAALASVRFYCWPQSRRHGPHRCNRPTCSKFQAGPRLQRAQCAYQCLVQQAAERGSDQLATEGSLQ
ncbi:hypothetical protein ACKKBF_B39640 [Auxenochlorella protothecoides x Auxenochlorella symbiontica]